ncbi:hypothetical protein F511_23188 [Dorcoceras hygrometricum]|uniref:Uncharacterized protein n=1 Tax=Dorcoceras hygrometricum TaxID=472368 RepID=A0A2Z7BFW7_9LAMI|nr:hypothetical protein F511_23188 [Dorcoceras hygrometricum]
MSLKDQKRSILVRCMKGSIKLMTKARDLCFHNMSTSGVHVLYGGGMSCPTPQLVSLPRSMSLSSSSSSYSTSSGEYSKRPSPMGRQQGSLAAPHVPRSQSATIGRIDENKCCEFEVAYPRSRSCAAPRRRRIASGYHEMDVKYKRL